MPSRQRLVLIIEDSLDVQSLLASLLQSGGYRVTCVESGQAALNWLRASTELPGLILLDLMMPEMDGFAFRREQERDGRLATIPVVVMTADGQIQSQTMSLGAKAFLKKPFFSVQMILDTVDSHYSGG